MIDRAKAERRAARLLRLYPRAWRLRYGEEFTQLLIADIVDRPRSWRRTVDVARRGLAVRFGRRPAVAGLVLLVTFVACSWIIGTYMATHSNWAQIDCGTHCTPAVVAHIRESASWRERTLSDSAWAIPLAIGVGLAGAAIALVIYRPHRLRR